MSTFTKPSSNKFTARFVAAVSLLIASTHASATDILTTVAQTFGTGAGIALNLISAGVFLGAGYVIVTSLMDVSRGRKPWGEVAGSVIGAGIIAIIVGALVALAEPVVTALG